MNETDVLRAVLQSQQLADDTPEMRALEQHRAEVEAVLQQKFSGCDFKFGYGGSRAKGTLIAESFDLDLVFYLASGEGGAGATLSDIYLNVANALRPFYQVREKTSAIRLLSGDKDTLGQDFHIDVVPGRFTDDTASDCFIFQKDAEKSRLKTNLRTHVAHVRGSGVLDAIRLLKLLRVRRAVHIKQFVWELLCIELLRDKKALTLPDQMLTVLRAVAAADEPIRVEDPANPAGNDLTGALAVQWRSLQGVAKVSLQQLSEGGWKAVFPLPAVEAKSARAYAAASSAPIASKPWSS